MISFKNKKKWLKAILPIVIIFSFFIININQTNAAEGWRMIGDTGAADLADAGEIDGKNGGFLGLPTPSKIMDNMIVGCLQLLQAFSGFILGVGMSVVDMTMTDQLYEEVFFSGNALTAINTGWGLVRDFVNIFFILILIFVAIATILRINKYSDKKFIIYVVSAALFVNFSKPITLFFIDISNLAMSFFLSNIKEGSASYSAALLNSVGMGASFKSETGGSNVALYISMIIEAIFKFIMGIMLLALGMSLILRLIALWVLIILSPLAFFALALPGTAIGSIKTTWFSKLTYWCAFGPVMLFFLWLALVLVSAVSINVTASGGGVQMAGTQSENLVIGALRILVPFSACIYMLFYGFDLSKKIASQAGDGAAWGLGKAGKLAKGAVYAGTLGYGLGYGKAAVDNTKTWYKENNEARMLSKRAQIGSKSAKLAHQQKLQQEQTKNWDENGIPNEDALKKMLKANPTTLNSLANLAGGKGSNTTAQLIARKKAAAMKLAEDGKLGMTKDDDSYARAYELFKNSPEALDKFEKLARKKNRGEMIEHEISRNMSKELDKKVIDENTKLGGVSMSKESEDRFREKARKEYIEKTYSDNLGKMKLSDITDQSVDFLKNDNVKTYIKEKQASGDDRFSQEQLRKHAAEKTDGLKQEALKEIISGITKEDLGDNEARKAMKGMNE